MSPRELLPDDASKCTCENCKSEIILGSEAFKEEGWTQYGSDLLCPRCLKGLISEWAKKEKKRKSTPTRKDAFEKNLDVVNQVVGLCNSQNHLLKWTEELESHIRHEKLFPDDELRAIFDDFPIKKSFEQMMMALRDFHHQFEQALNLEPTLEHPCVRALRAQLIQEELDEYKVALDAGDLLGIADALGDLLYVVLGAAVTHGLDLEGIFWEIHRSNMTKVGGHKDDNGKWIKPATYSPANLTRYVVPLPTCEDGGCDDVCKERNDCGGKVVDEKRCSTCHYHSSGCNHPDYKNANFDCSAGQHWHPAL